METLKVLFNEEKRRFEVYKIYEEGFQALLLVQTIDEVKELLLEHVTQTLLAIGA